MRSNLHSYWNKDLSHTRVFGKSMGSWLSTFKGKFKGGWSSLGTGVENIFKGLWKNLKKFARDGMNNVIDIINDGIKAVDAVIHSFGSKNKRTIPTLDRLATGTGMFSGQRKPITRPTMAMLNDGNDSPQTDNKEMVMLPNGDSGIVQGRNTKMMLPAGSEVLSASETAMLMAMQGVTKYAKGTGFFGDILNSVTSGISGVTSWVGKKVGSLEKFFKTAENIIAHPIKSLENLFSWSSKGVSGVMSNIGHGLFNGVEKQAKTWWSTLWGGVSDSLDSGASSSTLVNAMEKYGATNKYVYGAEGPSAFDCSGLVEYTLKNSELVSHGLVVSSIRLLSMSAILNRVTWYSLALVVAITLGYTPAMANSTVLKMSMMVWALVKFTAAAMVRLLVTDEFPVYLIALARIRHLSLVAC